jgi:hypothetical protein
LIVSFAFILFASGAVFLSVGDQSISGEPDKKNTTKTPQKQKLVLENVFWVVGFLLLLVGFYYDVTEEIIKKTQVNLLFSFSFLFLSPCGGKKIIFILVAILFFPRLFRER